MDEKNKRETEEEIASVNESASAPLAIGDDKKPVIEIVTDASSINFDALKDTKGIIENIGKMMSSAIAAYSRISSFYDEYGENIRNTLSNISNAITWAIAKLEIPELSEQKRKALQNSYDQWGELGWTIIPASPPRFFGTAPISIKDANKKAEQYCKKANLEILFDEMRKKRIKKSDLEEAIFCFENRKYKACSLVLLGLIDSKLIKLMPKPESKKKRRPVGFGATKKIEEAFYSSQEIISEIGLDGLLKYSNLFVGMKTVFAPANDFKDEPYSINRNFVDHGMTDRNVRRRDCIQLFLMLNNLVDALKLFNKLNIGH